MDTGGGAKTANELRNKFVSNSLSLVVWKSVCLSPLGEVIADRHHILIVVARSR